MYRLSSHNAIIENERGKLIVNNKTALGLPYHARVESILKQINHFNDQDASLTIDAAIDALLIYELLDKGIVVPADIDDEVDYLKQRAPLKLPAKGVFGATRLSLQNLPLIEQPSLLFVGIPCDLGSPKPGSRFGPMLIRERSHDMSFGVENGSYLYHLTDQAKINTQTRLYDLGDIEFERGGLDSWQDKVTATFEKINNKHTPITIGGDHSFTYSILKGLCSKREKFTLVQFDHHLDIQTWGNFADGRPQELDQLIHSNFISWVKQDMPYVDIIQLGVNEHQHIKTDVSPKEVKSYFKAVGQQISNLKLNEADQQSIIKNLPIDQDMYISIDVDAIDSAYLPDTGYPAPIGIQVGALLAMLRHLIASNNIIGIDIMEFGKSGDKFAQFKSCCTMNIILLEIIHLLDSKR